MSFKEVQKRKNLNSRVLQLQVNRFISNVNNIIIMPSRPIRASVNKNGFIEVLNGAIKSNDFETLESIMPKEVDLSIKQNGGFSVFFWLYTSKITKKDLVYYIFKKGGTVDQFTPSVGLTVIEIEEKKQEKKEVTNLIVELSTSKSKKETLFANKRIEENHLYSIGISFSIDYDDDSTEVSLFIDGKLDTQSTIPGEPIHNQGSVFFGRPDSSTHGFKGTVADVMMVPSIITEKEVSMAHSEGLKNLSDSNGLTLGMSTVFGEIFKRKKLINKYAFYTKKTVYEIENLCLSNSKMLEIVKNYDKEERENDIRPPPKQRDFKQEKMIAEMTIFLSDINNRILCNKIDINGQLINTCFFLANQGEELLEIDRVIKIFDTLKEVLLFTIDRKFIETLAKLRKRCKEENLPVVPRASRALQWTADDKTPYTCGAGLRHFTLMYNGDVMICRRLNFPVGNLLKENWSDILERIYPILKAIHSLPDECKNCSHASICNGGLKCLTYAMYGDFNHKDVNCFLET